MSKGIFYSILMYVFAIYGIGGGCSKVSKPTETMEKKGIEAVSAQENIIEIEAEGESLHYMEKRIWATSEFQKIVKGNVKANLMKRFKKTYHINASNFNVEINEGEKMTILRCDIPVIFKGWYDFSWFLKSLGLDFLDNHFIRKEKELLWKGDLNGVKTTILLKFPFRIDNCHAHVWPVK